MTQTTLPLEGGVMAEQSTALEFSQPELIAPPNAPMAIIADALSRGIDVEKLLEWQERYDRNRAAEAYGEAVTRFQASCPVIVKNREAKASGNFGGYKYADYADVMRQAGPALEACRLVPSFSTDQNDGRLKITCRVRHGIHFEESTFTVPLPADMRVNDTQKWGAALSYAKRYALCAALNIVVSDEDTDAQGLQQSITQDQYALLEELITESGADRKRFLAVYQVEKLGDLPLSKFEDAYGALKRKQVQAQKR